MNGYTRVALEDVEVATSVGFYDWEREGGRKTRLVVGVELFSSALSWSDRELGDFINYDRVHRYIMGWGDAPETRTLETLVNRLIDFCFEDAKVERCRAKVSKLDIYSTGTPSVEIERIRKAIGTASPAASD